MAEDKRTSSLALEDVKNLLKAHNKNNDKSAEIAAALKEALALFSESNRQQEDRNALENLLANNRIKNILTKDQQLELQKGLKNLANPNPEPSQENQQPSPDKPAENEVSALDYSVLNKDPKDMTIDNKKMLNAILADPKASSEARASAQAQLEKIIALNSKEEQKAPAPADQNKEQNNPSPDPKPLEEPITEEERNAALETLATSKYEASTISKTAIKAALKSDNPDIALANVDDMLAAALYVKKQNNAEDTAKMNGIIEARLQSITPEMITPDNAEAYRRLCEQCANDDIRKQALNAIADGIVKFDRENFGAFQPDVSNLEANYDYALKALKEKSPFAYPFNKEKDGVDLSKIELTYDNGSPLSEKDAKETKEAIAALAREMAAQRLAKSKGKINAETLESEYKKAALEILTNAGISMATDGKISVKNSKIGLTIANQYLEVDKFKQRVGQKFSKIKNCKLVKKVEANVNKVDKKLEKRFGKSYIYSKKVLKFFGKAGIDIGKGLVKNAPKLAKSAAIFAIAGAVPGGPAIAMGYFMYKNLKNTVKTLRDPNASRGKKAFAIVQSTVSASLSLVGMSTALDAGAEVLKNMGAESLSNWAAQGADLIQSGIGKAGSFLTAGTVSPEAVTTALSSLSSAGRIAITGGIMALPNIATGAKTGFQQFKLKRQIKKEKDPEKLAQLIAKQKILKENQVNNAKETLVKAGSMVAGMFFSREVSELIHGAAQSDMVSHATENIKAAVTENPFTQSPSPDFDPNKPFDWNSLSNDGTHAPWQAQSVENTADTGEIRVPYEPGQEPHEPTPDEVSGMKAHNLEAAKAENSSGIAGKSAYAHALQHLESLGDSRITDTNAMAENISEHVGDKANLAVIACKMAPYALQDALHMDIPNNGNPTSYNMLSAISNNELTPEQQTALNDFIEKNFDGTRIKMENFAAYNAHYNANRQPSESSMSQPKHPELLRVGADELRTPVYHGQPQVQVAVETNTQAGENAKVTNNINVNVNVNGGGTVLAEQQPAEQYQHVEAVYGSVAWAQSKGLIYDPQLSETLNTMGTLNSDGTLRHGGYAGVFLDPTDPRHQRAILIPNDPVHNKIETTTITVLQEQMQKQCGPYGHGEFEAQKVLGNRTAGILAGTRSLYGSGLTTVSPYAGQLTAYIDQQPDPFYENTHKANITMETVRHGTQVARDVLATIGFGKHIFGGKG